MGGSAGSTPGTMPGGSTGSTPGTADGSMGLPGADGMGAGAGDAPGTGADAGAGGATADAAGASPGLGGQGSNAASPPGIIGDMQPFSQVKLGTPSPAATRFPNLPGGIPAPGIRGGNTGVVGSAGTSSLIFKAVGLKISDNQSPAPQDRVFYSFNYFDNLNASVDKHIGSPVQNLQVYHELFGIEKTFWDGQGSFGFRIPLNTISLKSTANVAGLGGTSTATGDLSIFMKYVLYRNDRGGLITTGIQVTPPTGPGAFGGNKYYSYFRDTQIQPFIGYIFSKNRFFLQGFSSINVPTDSRDATLLFTDVAIGYYAYRPTDLNRLVSAIVPTAEAHLTTPLNHRGFNPNDIASMPDILNMTVGTNLELRRRAVITAAYVTPVTGPKPFNAELVLLLNIRFGASGRTSSLPLIPTAN
jgi:hypothetical protein